MQDQRTEFVSRDDTARKRSTEAAHTKRACQIEKRVINGNKAQATVYTGRRTPIKQGDVFKGTAKLIRNGRVIAEETVGPTDF